MAVVLEFPVCVGPFTMSPAQLAGAFNAFYRQHQFPKPDPTSDENSMAGLDPSAAGQGMRDIVFSQLSPLHEITLDEETKAAACIPKDARFFAWAYPVVQDGASTLNGFQGAEAAFLEYGGYIYFNSSRDVVGTNSILPAPLGSLGLMFGRSQQLPVAVADTLTRQGRFQEVTLAPLTQKGATHFAWIRPSEFSDSVASPDGCFAYKFATGRPKYYPVVTKAVFTPDLLEETLEDTEAWVVLRGAAGKRPEVETHLVFDRTKTFEENVESAMPGTSGVGPMSGLAIGKDSQERTTMSYEEWATSSDSGTIGDPWIIQVLH
mmetsp:Transcript_120615/g.257594  ORF Transcript_120615/g.257594 Transcript_120615/m.257594 type:complete len:320 (+) Transcript_120615:88-1047(+)